MYAQENGECWFISSYDDGASYEVFLKLHGISYTYTSGLIKKFSPRVLTVSQLAAALS